MGFEGSANKLGVGIVKDDGSILANIRHTYPSVTFIHTIQFHLNAIISPPPIIPSSSSPLPSPLLNFYFNITYIHHPSWYWVFT